MFLEQINKTLQQSQMEVGQMQYACLEVRGMQQA